MLTSSLELIPQSVTPMENDVLCAVHHAEPQPQTVCHSSVLHSYDDDIGRSSSQRRSGRLLRNKEQTEDGVGSGKSAKAPIQQQINTSFNRKERGSSKKTEDHGETQDTQSGDNTLRGCKRKLELSSGTLQSHVSKDSSTLQDCSQRPHDLEPKCLESPPPAKRWVIGPLFQSFKSKMASFTEIVMSPVRLFKPNDSVLSNTQPHHHVQLSDSNNESLSATTEEQAEDGKDEVFSKRESGSTPHKQTTVVQRLRFNSNSSNVSDPVENKVSVSSDKSENQDVLSGVSQSVLENDASLNVLSTRDLANEVTEPVLASDAQKHTSFSKPVYENEAYVATSSSKQVDCSNSSQEKSVFTKPGLLLGLTDTADTTSIKPSSLEAPCLNSLSCSLSFTEDTDSRDMMDPEESILRIPIRTSPRKRLTQFSESQGLSPMKSTIKTSSTLFECKSLDDTRTDSPDKCNSKAHIHPLSKDKEVPTPNYGLDRKSKETPKTETVRSLEKNDVVKKVKSSSKRFKKEGKVSSVEESPVSQTGKRRKVQVSDNLSFSICNAREVDMTGSFESLVREKVGQERASRSRSKRDATFRTTPAVKIENSASDNSSSSDTMKSALMDNGLQGNCANVTDICGNNELLKSRSPQRMVADESSNKNVTSRKTRQHKVKSKTALSKNKDLIVLLEQHSFGRKVSLGSSAGQSGDGFLDTQESGNATNHERPKRVRKNNIREAKHKLETSDVATTGVVAQNVLHCSKQSEMRAGKSVDGIEEQRVSMSLTLQVGAEADQQEGDIGPSVQCESSSRWQAARQVKSCRITRRMGKMETAVSSFDAPSVSKSTPVHLKKEATVEEDDGRLSKSVKLSREQKKSNKSVILSREQKKSKVDRQRRKCVSLSKRKDAHENEEETLDGAEEAPPPVVSSGSGSTRLLRSFSCPDIPSLIHSDHAPPASFHHPVPPSPPKMLCPVQPQAHPPLSPSKRARRHTVCSVEIEREIAPLCLRKEVHPTASNHMYPHSHTCSITALASCFLSSPLAFLSKKSGYGCSDDGPHPAPASPRSFTKSPSPSFLKFPTSPTLTVNPAFSTSVPPTPEQSSASVSSPCRVFEPVPIEADVVQQEIEEDERSSFSLDLSSRVISEEKALSDSEIKADDKQVERRKVSSIRIRKTLPKPQYNLTPMGLPKAIRIKKKVFTVEEIYTNKNYSKPPEGRLETIFEVPLSRRDGSESMTGQKRVKRFIEFPELGVARKPRKPLVGGAGVGGAQRKAAGNSGAGRTRRGVEASTKNEDALNPQLLDSLLCSKLNELDSWMALEQTVY